MTHIKTQKLLRPTKDLGGRIFTTVLLFRRKKEKKLTLSRGPKNTARGVRFLLGFNMYLFLAQCEQVYLFLTLAPQKTATKRQMIYPPGLFGQNTVLRSICEGSRFDLDILSIRRHPAVTHSQSPC